MSECVVRMEMPENCDECPMCGTASGWNGMYKLWCMCGDIPASAQRIPGDCPIICQLPEGHGRLVDADAIPYSVSENGCMDDYAFRYDINELPTIVPAERMANDELSCR